MSTKVKDTILSLLVYLSSFLTICSLVAILGYILWNGLGALNFNFFMELAPSIITTLLVIFVSILISVPIGICAAIYLHEYAKNKRVVELINFAIDSLAGIPSILYGLFGLVFFVITMKLNWSILAGSLTLGIMILPTIIRVTQESLKMVPDSFREGSFALGASKVTTLLKIIIPAAIRGIITAVILSIGRIVGETAAVFLTVGTVDKVPDGVMSSGRTLSVHFYLLVKEAIGPDAFNQAFGTATLLIIIVLMIVLFTQFLFRGRND
ncbi:MAG: phosphate ABC transporter permease PstA [Firmicutes bacterium]|nr:phosphate ABC transporter permease PstA [Bacillota bacterium]